MQLPLSLSLLAGAAIGVLAAEELKIDVTLPVECDRPTKKGDSIDVHYRRTLQSNGSKFDAGTSRLDMPEQHRQHLCPSGLRSRHPLQLQPWRRHGHQGVRRPKRTC